MVFTRKQMSQNLKEKTLRPEIQGASVTARGPEPGDAADPAARFDERILTALRAATEKKAADLTVLDLREIASFTDYFLIASGSNKRQVQAIADAVVEQLKSRGTPSARVEGYQTAEWILADYGDFVVHVFEDRARRFYDLERLWREARRIDIAAEHLGPETPSLRSEVSDL
jgi:ribosome-associated protein